MNHPPLSTSQSPASTTRHSGAEETGGLRRQGAKFDEMLEPSGAGDELPDVDSPMAARDVRYHYVQSGAVTEGSVDERR